MYEVLKNLDSNKANCLDPGRFLEKKDQMEKQEKINKLNGHTLNLAAMSLVPKRGSILTSQVTNEQDKD